MSKAFALITLILLIQSCGSKKNETAVEQGCNLNGQSVACGIYNDVTDLQANALGLSFAYSGRATLHRSISRNDENYRITFLENPRLHAQEGNFSCGIKGNQRSFEFSFKNAGRRGAVILLKNQGKNFLFSNRNNNATLFDPAGFNLKRKSRVRSGHVQSNDQGQIKLRRLGQDEVWVEIKFTCQFNASKQNRRSLR